VRVPIKVLHVGIGPIGAGVVRQVAARRGFTIVGAVDVDPAKAGRDLGEVCDVGRKLRVKVTDDLAKTIKAVRPDIAVLCTSSSLKKVVPEFEAVLKLKVPIVSTTEELVYPVKSNAAAARRIDALAKRSRVAVLGTGVNPGFLMDALPIALTAVCQRVTAIEIDRVQDARVRRLPFQLKIGAGLTRDEFMARVKEQTVRHVGLAESITMIADALGWKLDRVTDDVHPKMADQAVASDVVSVEAGRVCGLIQDGVGYRRGQPIIKLHMEAYDAVRVIGDPPLAMKLAGGVHGDIATASIVVNSIPKVLQAQPGLRTMRDVALPSFFPG
jgi:4-hydroxy-tetrahydrodipicolinate reductase